MKKGQKNKGIEKQNQEEEFQYLKKLIDYNKKYATRLQDDSDLFRYGNIRCYKDNFVEVSTPHESINASWIHLPKKNSFISAQAPLINTIDDFWEMCFDHNINLIIMLCNLEENGKEKCTEYWNVDKFSNLKESIAIRSNFSIKFTTDKINDDITIRICTVRNKVTDAQKIIKQVQYGGWPDHEIPDMKDVYGNILFMFQLVDNYNFQGPVCVHCSAGVGRTGTFIALYNIYRDIIYQIRNEKRNVISFSLLNIVRKLKEMRLYLVENVKQYKMIYQFISKFLLDRN